MAKATKAKQLSFSLDSRTGLLSEVTAAIAAAKVDITAVCAYEMDGRAYFMLSADSTAKAKRALSGLGISADEEDVVSVEMANKPGELHKAAKRIADAGINISYMYATAGAGRASTGVFSTADDARAIKAINSKST
ncbi:MAG: hypothetical protein Kow0025_17600 [Thermodesulfovibrionales bacterium]